MVKPELPQNYTHVEVGFTFELCTCNVCGSILLTTTIPAHEFWHQGIKDVIDLLTSVTVKVQDEFKVKF